MRPDLPLLRTCALLVATLLLAASCAGSSSKRGGRTVLMSEYDDARVGEEGAREVAAEIGVFDDPEIAAYVERVGRKLLRGVPRAFAYEFRVVDQLEPNAFALPGGYVFVSRGLIALVEDEDELANVIGHEIAHAAQRHAAAQQSLARRNPLAMPWVRAANLAAYSRDMERAADEGGQRLAAAAGYDPMALSRFLERLEQADRMLRGHTRAPTFFDTHPGSVERAAATAVRAREIRFRRDAPPGDTRASHLDRIDGMPVGQRPETGLFVGDLFVHPELDFEIRFPHGWRASNAATAVGAVEPEGRAVVYLTAGLPAGEPEEVARGFVEHTRREGSVEVRRSQPVQVGALAAWRMELETRSRGVSLLQNVTLIPYRSATYRVTGLSLARAAERYEGRILATARSFRPLDDERRRSLSWERLRVVTARAGEDLTALSERTDNVWDTQQTAVYNAVFADHRFAGGERVKIARRERLAAAR